MCMNQVLQIGFSPKDCLFFDHIFRREKTRDLKVYPEPIFQIHESFLFTLRQKMGAPVEIAWGAYVRHRTQRACTLEKLRLWGAFKDVDIWLEWESSQKQFLTRVIVFVMHPQAMVYVSRGPKSILQDLHLTAAARLANISTDESFYEITHQKNTYGKIRGFCREIQRSLESKARVEVAKAISNWKGGVVGVCAAPALPMGLEQDTSSDSESQLLDDVSLETRHEVSRTQSPTFAFDPQC